MLEQNIFRFYWFGTCMRYLQDVREGARLFEDGGVVQNLRAFFGYLSELELNVTRRAAYKVESLQAELEAQDPTSTLTAEQASRLTNAVNALRDTLDAELTGYAAYVVTPKRIDVTRLLKDPASLLAPRVFQKLPPIAQRDLVEAGKCIAFERSTAAAFHVLRATEATLRAFDRRLVKRGKRPQLWGPIVQDLRGRRASAPYAALLNHLDHIRGAFRNPTQHPDAEYDIHECQDLFSLCVDALNRMAKALPELPS